MRTLYQNYEFYSRFLWEKKTAYCNRTKRKKPAHRKTNNFNFAKIYLFSKLWCFCNDDNRGFVGFFYYSLALCFVMNTIYVLIICFAFHARIYITYSLAYIGAKCKFRTWYNIWETNLIFMVKDSVLKWFKHIVFTKWFLFYDRITLDFISVMTYWLNIFYSWTPRQWF